MSMMQMTAILIFIYFTCIWLIVILLSKVRQKNIVNISFIVLNCIYFGLLNVIYYGGKQNFRFLMFDNISPFTFTFMPFLLVFRNKVKVCFLAAISFLSIGMFVAMLVTPQQAYLVNFNNESGMDFLLDALCHLNCSLFGIYLISSGQVKISIKNLVKSTVFMYFVITSGVAMNYIFHTNNFGMCPYGGYSIYFIDIFEEYWATLLAYYVGVFLVLSIGLFSNWFLNYVAGNDLAFKNVEPEKRYFMDEVE